MTGSQPGSVFFSCPVSDYRGPADWQGSEVAYRVRPEDVMRLLQRDDAHELKALVINSQGVRILDVLTNARERLGGLLALMVDDPTGRDLDVGQLLRLFNRLEVLRLRTGSGLAFSPGSHRHLRALIVETPGLPRQALSDLCRWDLRNLVHLDLCLGSNNHGWDGSIDDLQTIMQGHCFPNLRYLGLRKSEIADEIASAIVAAPVLDRLDVLDLSHGNLSDRGGRALLCLPWNVRLRQLVLREHALSETMLRQLDKELLCRVVTGDAREEPTMELQWS